MSFMRGRAPARALVPIQKPFGMSRRATNKSARKGREARSKLPS